MERADYWQFRARVSALLEEEIVPEEAVIACVNADGDVEFRHGIVQPEEIRGVEIQVILDPPHEHRTRAVLPGPRQLLQRLVHAHKGEHRCPAQPSLTLAPYVGQPAVVTLTEGDLDLRAPGQRS